MRSGPRSRRGSGPMRGSMGIDLSPGTGTMPKAMGCTAMMRIGVIIGLAMLALGCSSHSGAPEVSDCRNRLLSTLKAPASYKEVDADSVLIAHEIHDPTLDQLRKGMKLLDEAKGIEPKSPLLYPYKLVTIRYDAQNSYGALLRDSAFCSYSIQNGVADTNKLLTSSMDSLAD